MGLHTLAWCLCQPLTLNFLLQGSLGPPGPPGLGVSTGVSSWWEFEGPKLPKSTPLQLLLRSLGAIWAVSSHPQRCPTSSRVMGWVVGNPLHPQQAPDPILGIAGQRPPWTSCEYLQPSCPPPKACPTTLQSQHGHQVPSQGEGGAWWGRQSPVPEGSWPALGGYRIESELLLGPQSSLGAEPLSHFLPSQGEAGVKRPPRVELASGAPR